MQILGRTVEAIQYKDTLILNAYVNLGLNDCRKKEEQGYQCIGDCEGRLVIARFQDKTPISIKALIPMELNVHPEVPVLRDAKDLASLEKAAEQEGYELRDVNKGKVLYLNEQPVANYNPCGFSTNPNLFVGDVSETVTELVKRVDEVYEIAETKPLEAILEDAALAAQLSNPAILSAMAAMCGPEGAKLVEQLRKMQQKGK